MPTAYNKGPVANDVAKKLLDDALADRRRRGEVEEHRMVPKVLAALPATKAARYIQIENKIRAAIRYELADGHSARRVRAAGLVSLLGFLAFVSSPCTGSRAPVGFLPWRRDVGLNPSARKRARRGAVLDLPSTVFVRSGDALHLACAEEHGFQEVYTNDRHMLQAAKHFPRDRGERPR